MSWLQACLVLDEFLCIACNSVCWLSPSAVASCPHPTASQAVTNAEQLLDQQHHERLSSKEHATSAGAGQGIGRAFAHALGEAGASVAVVDINFKKAQVVTEELRSKGIRSIAVGTDVTKQADCKK